MRLVFFGGGKMVHRLRFVGFLGICVLILGLGVVLLDEARGSGYVLFERADLTGDGQDDIIMVGIWQVMTNEGLGGQKFGPEQLVGSLRGKMPISMEVADVLGNSLPDLTVNFEDRHTEVFENLGAGKFRPKTP